MARFENDVKNKLITGTNGNDYVENSGSQVTINTGGGNDTVYNPWGNSVTINTGDGNDNVNNGEYNSAFNVVISGGKGSDFIANNANDNVTIDGGAGNDFIENYWYDGGSNVSINAGSGNDTVVNIGSQVTINAGTGNDVILNGYVYDNDEYLFEDNGGEEIFFGHTSGKDTIFGFHDTDTLAIACVTYSKSVSGNNLIIKTDNGSITLIDGAELFKNIYIETNYGIVGEDTPTEMNSWTISGTTAKYGTSDKTLVTVKGVKSVDGLKVDKKVVTVANSALNKKKITISGSGYTLKLADDVTSPSTKKAAWSLKNSTTTYKSSYKTSGYKLASNSKSISYTAATTAETLASIKGAKSTSGISVSGKKITLKKSALKSKVTIGGGYEFNFASDYKSSTITGSSNSDSITVNGTKLSISGGKGNDTIKVLGNSNTVAGGAGSDVFIYKAGKSGVISDYAAEDKISLMSGAAEFTTSGSDVIINGKITVTGGKDKTISYVDSGGEKTYTYTEKNPSAGIKYSKDKTAATILASYSSESFVFPDGLISLDAAKASEPLKITGNRKMNSITGSSDNDTIDGGSGADTIRGGKGNDSIFGGASNDELYGGEGSDTLWGGIGDDYLYGGAGYDIFLYTPGDGIDRIFDYDSDMDTIKLLSGKVDNAEAAGTDIVFTIGDGKIIVENTSYAKVVDSSGTMLKDYHLKIKT